MAIVEGGDNTLAPAHGSATMKGDLSLLRSTLDGYRRRIERDRRAAFLGVALLAVGAAWVLSAISLYLGVELGRAAVAAVAVTAILPLAAVALERLTRPSLLHTARLLDARMDNRQRLVTALELGSHLEHGPLEAAQVETTQRYLAAQDPKVLAPVRSTRPHLLIAGGMLCLAIALFVLRGTGSEFVPYQAQALADTPEQLADIPTPTVPSGLPESELTPSPSPTGQAQDQASLPTSTADTSSQSGQKQLSAGAGQEDASQQAAESQKAQDSLQKLGDALNGQGAAQSASDNLRNGDYNKAAQDLKDLGTNSDQLSDAAKKDLADSLDKASRATTDDPNLSQAERSAADALRKGSYDDASRTLGDLGDAVQNTAGKVLTQQQMAQAFPSPTAQSQLQTGQQGAQNGAQGGQDNQDQQQQGASPNQQNQSGQSGQQGNQGQGQQQSGQGQQQGSQGSGGSSGKQGSQGQGSQGQQSGGQQSGQNSQSGPGSQGTEGQQGGGESQDDSGQGQPGQPGTGHKESGPTGSQLQGGATNPFELENQPGQGGQPGDPNDKPALTLDNSAGGSSSGPAPVAPGAASNLPGENGNVPVERWTIVERYFGGK